jgi:Flp pilus assembly protein TadD/outer membrane protein OmpA-like peptidoglycan-associated protein
MKSNKYALIGMIGATAVAFTGCDILKDMEYKTSPNPLEMHADSVVVTVTATVPAKGMGKKAIVDITPKLGDTPLKSVTYQGEKAKGNGKVIPYKSGGKITYTDKVAYKPSMEAADLTVHIVAKKGEKEKKNFHTEKIGDGTIITPYLRMSDNMVISAKDKFVRVTQHTQSAIINYDKDRHEVKPAEMRDKDIVEFEDFIKKVMDPNNRMTIKGIGITGHASPEGEEDRNNTLSTNRAKSAAEALAGSMKKLKWEEGAKAEYYSQRGAGEDWEGFKTAMQSSSIDDKDVILRILGQYNDVNQREKEIRNLAKTYTVIEKQILPPLRRSVIVANYDLSGKTDEELKQFASSKIGELNLEELMFAATLFDDVKDKERIYTEGTKMFANDWRVWNNAGVALYMQGKVADAKRMFEKSVSAEENAMNKNNLGACIHVEGDREKAMKLFQESTSAGKEVSYNIGLVNIQQAKYSDAVGNMGNYDTFNKALAQLLAGDVNGALSTLDKSADKDSAMGYYLKAIAGARQGNKDMVLNNLKSAVAKDASLKAKAAKDREFIKFFNDDAFKGVVK